MTFQELLHEIRALPRRDRLRLVACIAREAAAEELKERAEVSGAWSDVSDEEWEQFLKSIVEQRVQDRLRAPAPDPGSA